MSKEVDPAAPRPTGHFGRFRSNPWHYVPEALARSISLGPATDGEPGDDWVLTYTPDQRDKADRETVLVRLSPRALHELYVETKDCSPEARQTGHTAECDLCGDSVPLEKAVPNPRGDPVHRRCYVDAYGGHSARRRPPSRTGPHPGPGQRVRFRVVRSRPSCCRGCQVQSWKLTLWTRFERASRPPAQTNSLAGACRQPDD